MRHTLACVTDTEDLLRDRHNIYTSRASAATNKPTPMMDLITEILTAQQGNLLGKIFYVAALSSVLFFIPYALLSFSTPYKTTLDRFYDALMILFFIGLWALAYYDAGIEGLVATGVGLGMALSMYIAGVAFLLSFALLAKLGSVVTGASRPL